MSKHTPGPWNIEDRGMKITAGEAPKKILVAEVFETYGKLEAYKDNGRLIAAAPELLEALARLHRVAGKFDEDDSLEAALDQALEAMEKAEGWE